MKIARVPEALSREPFSTRTAEAAGISSHALRGAAWRQLFRGAWIAASTTVDRSTWLQAARLVLPVDAVLCGLSAAEDYGVDVRATDDIVVHAAFADRVPRQRRGLRLYQLQLAPEEVRRRGRWLVTTPLRTAFDCARWLPLVDAVVVTDALAHAGLLEFDDVLAFANAHPGVRWVRRIPEVVRLSDGRSESPMESRLRLLLVLAGFTGLEPQFVVRDGCGHFVGRVDLAFPALRVAVEYDGAWHWKQRRADDRRRDKLRALGWTVLVFSAEEYYGKPDMILQGVAEALADAAA
jgi:very-short-patch-repair endonuclease